MIHVVGCFILDHHKRKILLLHRIEADHYETVGGKVEPASCADPEYPTPKELQQNLEREVCEEIGAKAGLVNLQPLGTKRFRTFRGDIMIMHKFVAELDGVSSLEEPHLFDRMEWISLDKVKQYRVSPGSTVFIPELLHILKKQ